MTQINYFELQVKSLNYSKDKRWFRCFSSNKDETIEQFRLRSIEFIKIQKTLNKDLEWILPTELTEQLTSYRIVFIQKKQLNFSTFKMNMQYHITTTSGLSWTLGETDLLRGDLEFVAETEGHLVAFVMI